MNNLIRQLQYSSIHPAYFIPHNQRRVLRVRLFRVALAPLHGLHHYNRVPFPLELNYGFSSRSKMLRWNGFNRRESSLHEFWVRRVARDTTSDHPGHTGGFSRPVDRAYIAGRINKIGNIYIFECPTMQSGHYPRRPRWDLEYA